MPKNLFKHKSLVKIIGFILLFLTASVFFIVYFSYVNRVVKKVMGYPIRQDEFRLMSDRNRAETSRYFFEKYGADTGKNFWEKNYNGEIPQKLLEEKSLKDCVRMRIILGLGKKYEFIDFDDFEGLKKDLIIENKRRKEAVAKGDPIYGPQQYSISEYLDYITSTLTVKMPPKMKGDFFEVNDGLLKAFYEENKELLGYKGARVDIKVIEFPYRFDDSKEKKDELNKSVEDLRKKIDSNQNFEDLMKIYNQDNAPSEIVIKENTITHSRFPELFDIARALEPGEIKGPFKTSTSIVFIKCVDNNDKTEITFDEIKENIEKNYLGHLFSEYVEEKVNQSVNEKK